MTKCFGPLKVRTDWLKMANSFQSIPSSDQTDSHPFQTARVMTREQACSANATEDSVDPECQTARKVLQVFTTDEEQSIPAFNDFGLRNILEKVKDKKVAIFSIAGLPRKGKSFLLNLFVRFLRFRSTNKQDEWLNNKSDELSLVFDWRGGLKAHTKGIWLLDQPIVIEVGVRKQKVAVLLMDTQGCFDTESDFHTSIVYFTIGALMSQYQIYNTKDHISQSDLTNIQIFTQFSKYTTKSPMARAVGSVLPFQSVVCRNLLLLVRDAQLPDDKDYGFDGGKEALRIALDEDDAKSDTLRKARKLVKTSFNHLDVFLLPEPNTAIRKRQEKTKAIPKIRDIGEEFLKFANKLALFLFDDENIGVEKLKTGQELLKHTVDSYNVLKTRNIPKIEDSFQAMSKLIVTEKIFELKSVYGKKMTEFTMKGFVDTKALQQKHDTLVAELLGQFAKEVVMGSEEFIEEHRGYLKTHLIMEHERFSTMNEKEKNYTKQLLGEKIKALNASASLQLIQLTPCDAGRLKNKYEKLKSEALKQFADDSVAFNKHLCSPYEKSLCKDLEDSYQSIFFENTKKMVKSQSSEFLADYIKKMNEFCFEYHEKDPLYNKHTGLKKNYVSSLKKTSANNRECISVLEGLAQDIENKFQFYVKENGRNKDRLIERLDVKKSEKVNSYVSDMQTYYGGGKKTEDELKTKSSSLKTTLISEFSNHFKDCDVFRQKKKELGEEIDKKFNDAKTNNANIDDGCC